MSLLLSSLNRARLGGRAVYGLRVTVVRCYSGWLSPGAIPLSSVLASPVMGCAVQALQDSHSSPALHEVTLA